MHRRRAIAYAAAAGVALALTLPGTASTATARTAATTLSDVRRPPAPTGQLAAPPASPATAAVSPEVPTGFQDDRVIKHISEPTAVAFAPDGTAFVALKTGIIKSFDYDSATETFEPNAASTDFADLRTPVENYWDRGLLGIAVDPQFGTAGHDYVYAEYAYNRDPRDNPPVVPKWPSDPTGAYEDCAVPASTTSDGCVVMMRVTRLTAQRLAGSNGWTMVPGSETELFAGGCFQFGSHSAGDLKFGPGPSSPTQYLYATIGDGASFVDQDYGQEGNGGVGPCPDPTDQGGSLRAQDFRTSGDPLDVDGAIIRMDPATGRAPDGTTSNAARLVTYGQRNPWRFTFRPGTSQLWSRDVGSSGFEEVNRVDVGTQSLPVDLGWPCYEGAMGGSLRNAAWDALDVPVCESLYAAGPSAVQAPYFSYPTRSGTTLTPGEDCQTSTSAGSGVAFTAAAGPYPAAYDGALFFSDFARSCVWMLDKLANGDPDPTTIVPFVQAAGTPVDLVTGPGGEVYYVDYGVGDQGGVLTNGGAIHRIDYRPADQAPVASLVVQQSGTPSRADVTFDAGGTTDADDATGSLTYAWDLDGDGQFDDGTGPLQTRSYTQPTGVWVAVKVTDPHGLSDFDTTYVTIDPGNHPPVLGSVGPTASLTWHVGQLISFAATATDPDQTLADTDFTWDLVIRHCPGNVCHTHHVSTWHTAAGSFLAPDHEWPSHLLLTVTVTDAGGVSDTRQLRLDPQTSGLGFGTSPTGLPLTVDGVVGPEQQQTFIVGSTFGVAAPLTQTVGRRTWTFVRWSDGGGAVHSVVAPATARHYVATYRAVTAPITLRTQRSHLRILVNGATHRARWTHAFPVGSKVKVSAPRIQFLHGHEYVFSHWSDARHRSHKVLVPTGGLRLKAFFLKVR